MTRVAHSVGPDRWPWRTPRAQAATAQLCDTWQSWDATGQGEWRRLVGMGVCRLGVTSWSALVLDDLFRSTVGDSSEEWDLWCGLLHRRGGRPVHAEGASRAGLSALLAGASSEERGLLARYEVQNATFARDRRALAERSALARGTRQLLEQMALAHWARYGLDDEECRRLAGLMAQVTSPKRGLEGWTPDGQP